MAMSSLQFFTLILALRSALAELKCSAPNSCNGQTWTGYVMARFEGYESGNKSHVVGKTSGTRYPWVQAVGGNSGMYSYMKGTYFLADGTLTAVNSTIRAEIVLCNSYYSCAYSDVSRTFDSNLENPAPPDDYWQVYCRGLYGMPFSNVWGHRYINAHGGYCLVNATIDSVDIKGNIMDVVFGGYKSGMGTHITCRDGHRCNIQCWAYSCQDMTCNGNGCNVTYLYQPSVLPPQFQEIDYWTLYTQLEAKCNSGDSDVYLRDHSMWHHANHNQASLGVGNKMLCCRGQVSCYKKLVSIGNNHDVYATANQGMSEGRIQTAKRVFCFGSCAGSHIWAEEIHCISPGSCNISPLTMTGSSKNLVICAGYMACTGTIDSGGNGVPLTVIVYAASGLLKVQGKWPGCVNCGFVTCQSSDVCTFYILAPQISLPAKGRSTFEINCLGTCTIYCVDYNECPTCTGNCNYLTAEPTAATNPPTHAPSISPTAAPTIQPTVAPTNAPSLDPTSAPTAIPSAAPTITTDQPTLFPSSAPTMIPTRYPSNAPSSMPTSAPSAKPTVSPSQAPTYPPTAAPSFSPSAFPSHAPSFIPSAAPTLNPSQPPTDSTLNPSVDPTVSPSQNPTKPPTNAPSSAPSNYPSANPSKNPTISPSPSPTFSPSNSPTEESNGLFETISSDGSLNPTLMIISALILLIWICFCLMVCWLRGRRNMKAEIEKKAAEMVADMQKSKTNAAPTTAKMETNHVATESDFDVVLGGADEHKQDASNNTVVSHGATGSDAFDMIMSQMAEDE